MENKKKRKKQKKRRRGFTLIEILAVIVILGILLSFTIPNIVKQVKLAKEKAFFTSVSRQVENIKADNVINNSDYCMYNYDDDNEKNGNIDKMYVLVHMEDNDLIYSVYATKEGQKTINTYDFSKLNIDKSNEWEEEIDENRSYTYYMAKLYSNLFNDASEFNKFTKCEVKD